jgi:peptidoglycan hydrolase-like protein with peptidoglycan-binding domain
VTVPAWQEDYPRLCETLAPYYRTLPREQVEQLVESVFGPGTTPGAVEGLFVARTIVPESAKATWATEDTSQSALQSPRFAGDPDLQATLAGQLRLAAPGTPDYPAPVRSSGPAVAKIQQALIDLGYALPASGADGRFGQETGAAVTKYKTNKGISPNDPVVGRRTMLLLDQEFPPGLPHSAIDVNKAIAANAQYAVQLGWGSQYAQILGLLGLDASATPDVFANAVASWQQGRGLSIDGIIGPDTWAQMQPLPPTPPGPTPPPPAPTPSSTQQFIHDAAGPAQVTQGEYGVPAAVTLAQAILESDSGKRHIGKANNYFGIKARGPSSFGSIAIGAVQAPTREVINGQSVIVNAWFRAYKDMNDSFRDHGDFLRSNSRYQPAFQYANDPDEFARQIAKAGYATDPSYANSLISRMRTYNLYQYD